jgi:hypothetical protein
MFLFFTTKRTKNRGQKTRPFSESSSIEAQGSRRRTTSPARRHEGATAQIQETLDSHTHPFAIPLSFPVSSSRPLSVSFVAEASRAVKRFGGEAA